MAEKKPLVLNNGEFEQLQSGDTLAGAGQGVPTGGTTGQILAKSSSTDYATEWVDAPSGGGDGTVTEVIKTETGTLSAADVSGTILNNYGQSNDVTLTLPTAAEGLTFLCVLGTTVAKYFRLKAATNDQIYLGGVAGGDSKYVGIASAAVGKAISFSTFQTGASAYDWLAVIISGAWVAE